MKKSRKRFQENPLPAPEREVTVGDFTKVIIPAVFDRVIKAPWPTAERNGWTEEDYKEGARQIAEEIDFEILKNLKK